MAPKAGRIRSARGHDRAARKFRKTLDKAACKPANYLFLGDLNSMGLDYEYGKVGRKVQHARVSAEQEIGRLSYLAGKHSMRLATKNAGATWGNPSRPSMRSNLDHVVAADHLRFRQFDGADVDVRGWPKLQRRPTDCSTSCRTPSLSR